MVSDGAKAAVLGESEPVGLTKAVFEAVWEAAIHAVEDLQGTSDNPLLIPVGPQEGATPVVATYTVQDEFLNGTFGRTDSSDPAWYSQYNPPANAGLFYGNGEQVGALCTLPGAAYQVHYVDGSTTQWWWWVKTVDNLWVPAAAFAQITDSGQPALPLCGATS